MRQHTRIKWRKRKARLRNWWDRQRILPVALGVFIGLFAFALIV